MDNKKRREGPWVGHLVQCKISKGEVEENRHYQRVCKERKLLEPHNSS